MACMMYITTESNGCQAWVLLPVPTSATSRPRLPLLRYCWGQVYGQGFRVKGSGFRVKGLGLRVLGCRVKGLGFKV